jgi:outer membrane protein assembly factor BamB
VLAAEDGRQRVMSTPTVDGDVLYSLAWEGELVCANKSDGSIVWRRNLAKDFNGVYQAPGEGGAYSESVLIDGDKLICTPGAKDAAVVALNKHTGERSGRPPFPPTSGRRVAMRPGSRRLCSHWEGACDSTSSFQDAG